MLDVISVSTDSTIPPLGFRKCEDRKGISRFTARCEICTKQMIVQVSNGLLHTQSFMCV